jgi:hypothetical protein
METSVVLLALALIAVATVVIISAWKTGGGSPPAPKKAAVHRTRPRAKGPLLTVVAVRGSTHVTARTGTANGNVAYDGTVQKGDPAVAIRGRRLWVQIDSPENLRILVRGTVVHVPGLQPRVIIITPTGWRPA